MGVAAARGEAPHASPPLGIAEDAPDLVEQVGQKLDALGDAEAQARFKDAGATFWSHLSD